MKLKTQNINENKRVNMSYESTQANRISSLRRKIISPDGPFSLTQQNNLKKPISNRVPSIVSSSYQDKLQNFINKDYTFNKFDSFINTSIAETKRIDYKTVKIKNKKDKDLI